MVKTMKQDVHKLALPAYLRKGLAAFRIGDGNNQKYLIKSENNDQIIEFLPWQFFILEIMPGCDNYVKLASVFEDRYGRPIAEKAFKKLLLSIAEKGLFDVSASSHPILASYVTRMAQEGMSPHRDAPNSNTLATQNWSANTNDVHGRYEGPSSRTATANEPFIPSGRSGTFAVDNATGGKEERSISHLSRAMQKARVTESSNSEQPEALNKEQRPKMAYQAGAVAPESMSDSAIPQTQYRAAPGGLSVHNREFASKQVEKEESTPLPAATMEAFGFDNSVSNKGWKLFNPTILLRLFQPLLSPLQYTIYLLPLLLIASIFISLSNVSLIEGDVKRFLSSSSFIEHAIFSMVTVNLSVTMVTALVAYSYRATVNAFCIVFYMYFFPRFMVRIVNVQQMSRRERLWLNAAPLLLRLGLFSVGILIWYKTRTTHNVLAYFGMATSFASAISFLVTVNPLIKSNGYHLLANFLNQPHLRGKTYKALRNKLRGNVYSQADSNILAAYALASVLSGLVLVSVMLYVLSRFVELELGPAGIVVIVLIAALLLWRMIRRFNKFEKAYERSAQFERWHNRTVTNIEEEKNDKKRPKSMRVFLRRSFIFLILAALFLPYDYEPGGSFIVLPNEQQTITAQVSGIIESINYDGGEVLPKGTVLGQLSHSDYLAQVKIFTAKIEQQQAAINDLKSRPKPEEVQLAKSALSTQRTQAAFSKEKAARLAKLYEQGVISFEELDDARRKSEVDADQVREKRANLELVMSGATPDELAEAEAKLQSYIEERDHFQEKIEESVFYMPFDGKLITMHLKSRIGGYLKKGDPLAVAEKTEQVKVEIDLPENDISYVKPDSEIKCRFHVYSDKVFYGAVKAIDANVSGESDHKVIKVVTLLENTAGKIKSGMTGYAKISSEKMPLWRVLSLALTRFFQVEVWSWLP